MLAGFLLWFLGANLWLAWHESQTIDEAAQLTAGYSYITTRDFRLNPEHPPLLKELSAMPLLALDVKNVKDLSTWQQGDQWKAGKEFVYSSPASPRSILFTVRLMPIVIALALGALIFVLATYLTNRLFGLFALGLYCLDPNIIAHSHLVTTDIAAALGFLGALTALFYYANRPSIKRSLLVGACLGGALAFKFSIILLLLFVAIVLAASIFYFDKPKVNLAKKYWLLIKRFLLICFVALVTVWLFYGFEVVKPSSTAALAGDLAKNNALFNHLQNWYIPLYSYLRGLGRVLIHSQTSDSLTSVYLLGNYSGGSWYYFFVAILIKTPIAILLGSLVALISGIQLSIKHLKQKLVLSKKAFYTACLVLFVIIYLISSISVAINIGWRHILPIYPAIYILIATALWYLTVKLSFNWLKTAVLIGFSWFILAASFAWQWPYNLSYSNEIIPIINKQSNRPRLTDSNLDWGQDIYRLITYAKQNPTDNLYYEVFSNANMAALDAPDNLQPVKQLFNTQKCQLQNGKLVISYQVIYNDVNDNFACLRGVKPDMVIGSSILVFNSLSN